MTTTEAKKVRIEEAGFSNKAYNALARMGLKNLGDVCEKTEEDLKKRRSLGPKTLKIIKDVLESYGLELKKYDENHIFNLKLEKRIYRVLIEAGISTIPELVSTSQYKLESLGLGITAMKSIKQSLLKRGVDMSRYRREISINSGIDELDLSARTYHALRNKGILCVGEILKFSKQDLMKKVRNFGRKSAKELELELQKYGFQLKK